MSKGCGLSTACVNHTFCRAGVDLSIEEFNTIGDRVPLLANLKPHGKVQCQFLTFKL